MAKPKGRAAALLAQPGFITLRRRDVNDAFAAPVVSPPRSMPSTPRWRLAVDRAGQLLQSVGDEMQAYADGRHEDWHDSSVADRFHENLVEITELQARIDDLRSNF